MASAFAFRLRAKAGAPPSHADIDACARREEGRSAVGAPERSWHAKGRSAVTQKSVRCGRSLGASGDEARLRRTSRRVSRQRVSAPPGGPAPSDDRRPSAARFPTAVHLRACDGLGRNDGRHRSGDQAEVLGAAHSARQWSRHCARGATQASPTGRTPRPRVPPRASAPRPMGGS